MVIHSTGVTTCRSALVGIGGLGGSKLPYNPSAWVDAILSFKHKASISFVPHSHTCCGDLHSQNLWTIDSRAHVSHITQLLSTFVLIRLCHLLMATQQCHIAHSMRPSFFMLYLFHCILKDWGKMLPHFFATTDRNTWRLFNMSPPTLVVWPMNGVSSIHLHENQLGSHLRWSTLPS